MHGIKYFFLNKNNQTIQGGQKKFSGGLDNPGSPLVHSIKEHNSQIFFDLLNMLDMSRVVILDQYEKCAMPWMRSSWFAKSFIQRSV
jgi:hypothetical protein